MDWDGRRLETRQQKFNDAAINQRAHLHSRALAIPSPWTAASFTCISDPAYPAKVERVVRIDVEAWDLNCRQHFPKLIRAAEEAEDKP